MAGACQVTPVRSRAAAGALEPIMSTAVLSALSPSRLQPKSSAHVLDGTGLLALAGAILLLLVIGGASIWQSQENELALNVAQSAQGRRILVTDIRLAARAAESAQRGYLLTMDAEYLMPFEQAESAIPGILTNVEQQWPGDRRVEILAQSVTAKLAELRQTIRLAQAGDLTDALRIVRSNAGFENMRVIRDVTVILGKEQDDLTLQQAHRATRGSRLLVAIDIAGLVMVFALAGLIALGLRSYLATIRAAQSQTERAYAELEQTNSQLDETVRHRTAALTAANEEIQRFAYIVSHDLRAPLVNIMGFTSELEQAATKLSGYVAEQNAASELREAADEDIPEALRFIKLSTEKMDRLINAILRLSREGRRVLTAEPLDMAALLGRLIETMAHQAESRGATVILEPVPDIVADRLAVEQVLGNLVDNALKYLKPGRPGEIRLSGRQTGRTVRYEVRDNGRGIASKDYERVFELFRRAGDQTVPGEGIGLAHVRALVRRLGGSVDCVSEVDAGSTFVVTLPAVATYGRETMA
jgi:signal transduction histidine kinase